MANAVPTTLPSPSPSSSRAPAAAGRRRLGGDDGWHELAGDLVEQLAEAILLVDREGRPRAMNAAARRLLAQDSKLLLGPRGLQDGSASEAPELVHRIREACEGAELPRPLWIRREGRTPLQVRIVSLPSARGRRVALFMSEPPEPPDADEIRARFGTTPMESKVAQRLARGVRIETIAGDLGIAVQTVRGHLKQVFSKTGAHRQAELVALLLSTASH